MVIKRFSYSEMCSRLVELGTFSENVSATDDVQVILDYLYSELLDCCRRCCFSYFGDLFEVELTHKGIFVRTFHNYKSSKINFFPVSIEIFNSLKTSLDSLGKMYHFVVNSSSFDREKFKVVAIERPKKDSE